MVALHALHAARAHVSLMILMLTAAYYSLSLRLHSAPYVTLDPRQRMKMQEERRLLRRSSRGAMSVSTAESAAAAVSAAATSNKQLRPSMTRAQSTPDQDATMAAGRR